MPLTGLHDVSVTYGSDVRALDHVTLMAEQGQLMAVLGPSGSGKSVLLRAIAGLVPLVHGDILIGGQRVTALPPERRGVAMVFESTPLIPTLDVSRNIGRGLAFRHVPRAKAAERVQAQARNLHLDRLLRRAPSTLSAGEAARVGVGGALVQEPSVFLLDEPLAHLDPGERALVRRQVTDVVRNLGITTFYVTNDPGEVMGIADRVALLRDGGVVQVGTPGDLYDRPADLFAAGFIGSPSMGMLPARLVVSGRSAGFRVGARTLPLWDEPAPELVEHAGEDLVLGLRPEHVHDATDWQNPDVVTLPATVVRIEESRPVVVAAVEVQAPAVTAPGADRPEAAGAVLRCRFSRDSGLRPGDDVEVAVEAARAHVFDAGTGRALHHPQPSGER
jgi:multiple sugar transport system ATP-binding protein